MDRLTISQRLYISTAAFMLLIAVLAFFFIESVESQVHFAKQEKYGNIYQRPATFILIKLAEYERLAVLDSSNKKALMREKAKEIDVAFERLQSVDASLGETLQFTQALLSQAKQEHIKASALLAKWKALTAKEMPAVQVVQKTREMIADIRSMISYLGNASNIILDPELNSYYLGDVTLTALPQTLDRLGVIGTDVYRMLKEGKALHADQKVEIARLASFIEEADMGRIIGNFAILYVEDKKLRGGSETLVKNTESKLKAYQTATESLVQAMRYLAKDGEISKDAWMEKVSQAADAAVALFDPSISEFDVLLEKRINYYKHHIMLVLSCIVAGLLMAIGFFYVVIRSISKPLTDVQMKMHAIAQGELEGEIPHLRKRDAIGAMAKALQVFKENALERRRLAEEKVKQEKLAEQEKKELMKKLATDFQSSVQGIITAVTAAATELYQTSEAMQHSITRVSQQSQEISSSSQETAGSVANVSAAVEEMSASVREIASQVSKSSMLITDTAKQAEEGDKSAHLLSDTVIQIGGISQLIQDIAEHINLLALNATIESARAGDAGKGFAVVASEVKNLANQTTKATEEIAAQIENVRAASTGVMDILQNIQTSIRNVNEYSSGIASAIEEQSSATQEISSNMQHAANSVQHVTQNITHVTEDANHADIAAKEVLNAAQMLSQQAELLNQQVQLFLEKIAA